MTLNIASKKLNISVQNWRTCGHVHHIWRKNPHCLQLRKQSGETPGAAVADLVGTKHQRARTLKLISCTQASQEYVSTSSQVHSQFTSSMVHPSSCVQRATNGRGLEDEPCCSMSYICYIIHLACGSFWHMSSSPCCGGATRKSLPSPEFRST